MDSFISNSGPMLNSRSTEGGGVLLTSKLPLRETRNDRPDVPFYMDECREEPSYSGSSSPASIQDGERAPFISENRDPCERKDSKLTTDCCSDTDSENLKGVSAN
jgi:hypothetical protein